MAPTPSPELIELAQACGVATEFDDWRGKHVMVPVATIVAVLGALGIDASSPAVALADREDERWRQVLPGCVVTREGEVAQVRVHVPHGAPITVQLVLEDGSPPQELTRLNAYVEPRTVDGEILEAATFALPADLPLGWHQLVARTPGHTGRCPAVVSPAFLGVPARVPESHAVWGFMTQLYSVRSRASWGQGDLLDLAELARWSGSELGAGFVLVNPLHSPAPVPPIEASPYLPVTRRFVSPLYLRVEHVEEFGLLTVDQRDEVEALAAPLRSPGDAETRLDRDAVWAAKRAALHLVAQLPRTAARERDYQGFLAREGDGLRDFATWCALAEAHGPAWSDWPEELRSPSSPAVETARKELADAVDFHSWLQWLADEQLAHAQSTAVQSGMPLGVMHDLAVGVHADGADTWALQDVMARGVSVGAPPDAFNQQGQDWSQPPWRPDRLAAAGYAPYRDMLRTILRHSGGVRVDHMLGLFRLWWVPEGRSPALGTYVRYDHEALVGILALEAARAGAVVVGEDLGVFEPWVRDYLAERGVLGTSILWFERTGNGLPLPPERWRKLCLAAVTTHDLPPTAGYLTGEHVRLRDRLGLLTRSATEETQVDATERGRWLDLLIDRGWLEPGGDERAVVEALHRALAATPSRLLGVALTDAVGDRRAINQPGTNREYPNWRLPLADGSGQPVLIEDLKGSPRAAALAAAVRGARPA